VTLTVHEGESSETAVAAFCSAYMPDEIAGCTEQMLQVTDFFNLISIVCAHYMLHASCCIVCLAQLSLWCSVNAAVYIVVCFND
jgi:hypothetical protein